VSRRLVLGGSAVGVGWGTGASYRGSNPNHRWPLTRPRSRPPRPPALPTNRVKRIVKQLQKLTPTNRNGTLSAAAAQSAAEQLTQLFDAAAVQRAMDAYVEKATEALGPSYLEVRFVS